MRVLVTAFGPFGGQQINPALQVLNALPGQLHGTDLVKLEVPTAFHLSARAAIEKIRTIKPDAVVMLGQAGGRMGITVERVALNIDDADIPDNKGVKPADAPIAQDGPAAYFATLPIKSMVSAIIKSGVPASISNTAGTYVCNHLLYSVLHLLAKELPGTRAGFVHLPWLPEQIKKKDLSSFRLALEEQVRGVSAAIKAVIDG